MSSETSRSTSLPIYRFTNLPTSQAALIGAVLIVALLATRPMADWFRVQSPPDVVYGAQYEYRADFGDQIRLLAYDLERAPLPSSNARGDRSSNLPTIQIQAGSSLEVVLYWRALASLATDYSVFAHLDAPDGTTHAGADDLNPSDIPISHWLPSLYVRNPLTVDLPPDLPPIRYTLTAGVYDHKSGERLPLTGCDGCPMDVDALPLAYVWVSSPLAPDEGDVPNPLDLYLGDRITLLGYELAETDPATLTLYWRAETPPAGDYTLFIHALDAGGEVVAQFDAPPVGGLYPTGAWLSGQIILDAHALDLPGSTHSLAVGLYDPDSLARLPITDSSGGWVRDDAVVIQVAGDR